MPTLPWQDVGQDFHPDYYNMLDPMQNVVHKRLCNGFFLELQKEIPLQGMPSWMVSLLTNPFKNHVQRSKCWRIFHYWGFDMYLCHHFTKWFNFTSAIVSNDYSKPRNKMYATWGKHQLDDLRILAKHRRVEGTAEFKFLTSTVMWNPYRIDDTNIF